MFVAIGVPLLIILGVVIIPRSIHHQKKVYFIEYSAYDDYDIISSLANKYYLGSASSLEACQNRCDANPKCVLVVVDNSTQHCNFYSLKARYFFQSLQQSTTAGRVLKNDNNTINSNISRQLENDQIRIKCVDEPSLNCSLSKAMPIGRSSSVPIKIIYVKKLNGYMLLN